MLFINHNPAIELTVLHFGSCRKGFRCAARLKKKNPHLCSWCEIYCAVYSVRVLGGLGSVALDGIACTRRSGKCGPWWHSVYSEVWEVWPLMAWRARGLGSTGPFHRAKPALLSYIFWQCNFRKVQHLDWCLHVCGSWQVFQNYWNILSSLPVFLLGQAVADWQNQKFKTSLSPLSSKLLVFLNHFLSPTK